MDDSGLVIRENVLRRFFKLSVAKVFPGFFNYRLAKGASANLLVS